MSPLGFFPVFSLVNSSQSSAADTQQHSHPSYIYGAKINVLCFPHLADTLIIYTEPQTYTKNLLE